LRDIVEYEEAFGKRVVERADKMKAKYGDLLLTKVVGDDDGVYATIVSERDHKAKYAVKITKDSAFCSCPAFEPRSPCKHLIYLLMVLKDKAPPLFERAEEMMFKLYGR